jgi:acetyl-CoA carboxylase biotin carboxyl carrier protein
MTTEEIKELIRVVNETGIAELEVQRGDSRVRIKGAGSLKREVVVPVPVAVGSHVNPRDTLVVTSASEASPTSVPAPSETETDQLIKSPIVGTYYDSPSPDQPSFVSVGERVEPKQVLCIIESMKLMNEIEAEVGGILVAKHVENGRPVEYGQTLFTIRTR